MHCTADRVDVLAQTVLLLLLVLLLLPGCPGM
jgi:hypothetical protein